MSGPIVDVRGLHKTFVQPGPYPWSPSREVHAVQGVDFVVRPDEVVALVGQSGSGKTTVSRIILGLEQPTLGEVYIDGMPWHSMSERRRRPHRVNFQYVPQDAMGALDPQQSAIEHVVETLCVLGGYPRDEAQARALEMLKRLGLAARSHALPREMSGGEQRRVTLARVLALEPRLVVADEPTSGLDPDRRESVLKDLVGNLPKGSACIIVTHDMSEARQWCHRIFAMLDGRVIEEFGGRQKPQHPYARVLFEPWEGSPISGVLAETGCPFRPDCPLIEDDFSRRCESVTPKLATLCNDKVQEDGNIGVGEHRVACYALTQREVPSAG
jgi:peptide/nickel transport system ATP-binding protein